MDCSVYRNVILTPAYQDASVNLPIRVGAFLPDGSPLGHFAHRRRTLLSHFPVFMPPFRTMTGSFAYGGIIFDQYGHFITETLARYWYLYRQPDLPILWHRFNKRQEFSPWQQAILALLGLKQRQHVIVDHPVQVEEIRLADPGFVLFGYAQREQLLSIARYRTNATERIEKLWVSRRNIKDHGAVVNDAELEAALSDAGWTIYEPEKQTLQEQLKTFACSHRIAGIAGSAFHTLMLIRDMTAKIRIIPRFPFQMENFNYVAQIRRFDQRSDGSMIERLSGEGSDATVRVNSIQAVLDFAESS